MKGNESGSGPYTGPKYYMMTKSKTGTGHALMTPSGLWKSLCALCMCVYKHLHEKGNLQHRKLG